MPGVRITVPEGTTVSSKQPDVHQILSQTLEREVTLRETERRDQEVAEEYWPDLEGLDYRNTVTEFPLPEGTYFDCAAVHVLTTATLDRLRVLYPQGRFEVRRFRPDIVMETVNGLAGFVGNAWIGHTLAIGDTIRLSITGPCPRCVMTTLPQGDLPKEEWQAFMDDLQQTFAKFDVPQPEQRGLVVIVESTKEAIVVAPLQEGPAARRR